MREPRIEELLHAYHDGELSRFGRWRFERRLRREPALQQALAGLSQLSRELRVLDERDTAEADLWPAIALRLPALDARRSAPTPAQHGARGFGWWLAPVGAAVAAAALVLVVVYSGFWTEPRRSGGVVRWIDSGGRSVMVLDDDPDSTIIWVLDGAVEGAARGGRSDVV